MSASLGDRMKLYEGLESRRRFMPRLPILARLDGRCFSSFTKGLARPYDERLSRLMVDTTRHLVEESSGATLGYTQSDEITLVFIPPSRGEVFFDGRVQKLTSTLAAMASVYFNRHLPFKQDHLPTFDCRTWQVPDLAEAANCLLWRERDATKNSITMAARCYYSDTALFGKKGDEKQDMLFAKGVNWNDYPAFFKRGTYIVRRRVDAPFTAEEIATLPPLHHAHGNPDLVVSRLRIDALDIPPAGSIENLPDVLFSGAEPVLRD